MAKKSGGAKDRGPRGRAWTVVTFEDLEAWRQRQGLPKKRVADMLGVTNSTYHNWARKIAVATPTTQQRIHALINGGVATRALGGGAAAHDGADSEAVMQSTAQIVNAYLQSAKARLTPEELCSLIRSVSKALTV